VIRGCVPKKLMVYASHVHREIEDAAGFGWTIPSATFDWPTLIANKDKEIARLEAAYIANVENSGARILRARAVFEDAHHVRLSTGEVIKADHVLIATGAAPNHGLAIPGIEHVISSNEVFHLREQPKRIVIQGGGYIALEFATIFAGLGTDVTLIYRGRNILRGFDEDVRTHVRSELELAGIRIITECTVARVDETDAGYIARLSDGTALPADQVMFAIGRNPNVTGLRLDEIGVEIDPMNGGIAVDAYSQTSVPHIYAVGDVTHRLALTPIAIREGHAFADTVFGGKRVSVDHHDVPTAVFVQPEVGTVGLTEAEARMRYARVDIYKTTFRPMKATISGSKSRIMMKLVVDGDTDRVLGCHIVGPEAGELIQVVGIAIRMKATKADFDATVAVHPTAAEELVTLRKPTARYVREAAAE
jgi:glutathione reductase (NADPH)